MTTVEGAAAIVPPGECGRLAVGGERAGSVDHSRIKDGGEGGALLRRDMCCSSQRRRIPDIGISGATLKSPPRMSGEDFSVSPDQRVSASIQRSFARQ